MRVFSLLHNALAFQQHRTTIMGLLVCLQLRSLAAAKDWDGLDALVSERRPPIGLPPFIAAARANGAPKSALAR